VDGYDTLVKLGSEPCTSKVQKRLPPEELKSAQRPEPYDTLRQGFFCSCRSQRSLGSRKLTPIDPFATCGLSLLVSKAPWWLAADGDFPRVATRQDNVATVEYKFKRLPWMTLIIHLLRTVHCSKISLHEHHGRQQQGISHNPFPV
jgi:hypothetical protein